jgi:anti-sigma B factor antagonist
MTAGVQVTVRDFPPLVVLDLKGAITASSDEVLKAAYASASAQGAMNVLLNFARVDHLDSAGISVVIGILTQARQRGQRLLVSGLIPHYRKIFDLMGLPQFAPVFDTEEAAHRWVDTYTT